MSAFGGLQITNQGKNLQIKAQIGVQLKYTRIAIGDGSLGSGQQISNLTALINQVKNLSITKISVLSTGKADLETVLSNQDVTTSFYFREIGIFAQDPDAGEILYCYGNAGSNAELIPAGGGADVIEKNINIYVLTGNATNVTATIDDSLVYATQEDLSLKVDKVSGKQLSTEDYSTPEKTRLGMLKNIITDSTAPSSPVAGDFWYKVI